MAIDEIHLKPLRDARAAGYKITAEEILAAIDTLTPQQKRAVTLHFLEGNNITDTAKAMGISRQAVKTLMERAQVNLAAALSLPHISNIT
jgi:RNA polymerase sigma factor (sigma-70 family)